MRGKFRRARIERGKGLAKRVEKLPLQRVYVELIVLPASDLSKYFSSEEGLESWTGEVKRLEHISHRAASELESLCVADLFSVQILAGDENESVRVLLVGNGRLRQKHIGAKNRMGLV